MKKIHKKKVNNPFKTYRIKKVIKKMHKKIIKRLRKSNLKIKNIREIIYLRTVKKVKTT